MVTWVLRFCGIGFAIAMFIAAWDGAAENRRFEKSGQRVLVEPIRSYVESTKTTRKFGITTGESKSQSAEFFFTTLDKRRIKVNRNLPPEVLNTLVSGGDVYIEYLPEESTVTRFAGQTSSPALMALIGVVSLAVTGLLWRKM